MSPSAGVCEALSFVVGPSRASSKVLFTPSQKRLVKTSFISLPRAPPMVSRPKLITPTCASFSDLDQMLTPALFQRLDFQLRPVQFGFQIRNVRLWIKGRHKKRCPILPELTKMFQNMFNLRAL